MQSVLRARALLEWGGGGAVPCGVPQTQGQPPLLYCGELTSIRPPLPLFCTAPRIQFCFWHKLAPAGSFAPGFCVSALLFSVHMQCNDLRSPVDHIQARKTMPLDWTKSCTKHLPPIATCKVLMGCCRVSNFDVRYQVWVEDHVG